MSKLYINEERCKGCEDCGICLYFCKRKVFQVADRLTSRGVQPPEVVNPDACNGCENCMIYCPDLVIVVE